jgi:hypothetical protein
MFFEFVLHVLIVVVFGSICNLTRDICVGGVTRCEWRPAIQEARAGQRATRFQQLVCVERFDLLKFLGTDPKTSMWIGLSILFRDSTAALALYRLFFSELAVELQAIGSTLQHLSWDQQAQWSSNFLIHQIQRQPPCDPAAASMAAADEDGAATPASKYDDKKKSSGKNKLKDRLKRQLEDKKESVKESAATLAAKKVCYTN